MKDSIIQLILKKELREYYFKKNNLDELKNKIEDLKDTKYSAGAIWNNCEPVKGGGTKQEDKLIEINIKLELMEQNYENNMNLIKDIDKGLKQLEETELKIITSLWIQKIGINRLCNELNYSKSTIYRKSDEALRTLAICIYGG